MGKYIPRSRDRKETGDRRRNVGTSKYMHVQNACTGVVDIISNG
jgi:hypothetical protein